MPLRLAALIKSTHSPGNPAGLRPGGGPQPLCHFAKLPKDRAGATVLLADSVRGPWERRPRALEGDLAEESGCGQGWAR